MHMILGGRRGLSTWSTETYREWRADRNDPTTTRPHMMLVLCTGTKAREGELLFAELGCIAQTMQRRLDQEEFKNTSLFPVSPFTFYVYATQNTLANYMVRYSSSRSLAHGMAASCKLGLLRLVP